MKQRTHLDWINEINRVQGRSHIVERTERERKLTERIAELERENKQLKNELENKKQDLRFARKDS